MILYYGPILLGLDFPFISTILEANFDSSFITEEDIPLVERSFGEEPSKVHALHPMYPMKLDSPEHRDTVVHL